MEKKKEEYVQFNENGKLEPVHLNKTEELNKKLLLAIEEVDKLEGLQLENGKYTTVAERLKVLRKIFGFDIKVSNSIKYYDSVECRVETRIFIKIDNEWQGVANGHSLERRETNQYTANSLIEVAETSAVGRALAFLGLFGSNIASKEEVETKTKAKKETKGIKESSGEKQKETLIIEIEKKSNELNVSVDDLCYKYRKNTLNELTLTQLKQTIEILNDIDDDIPL